MTEEQRERRLMALKLRKEGLSYAAIGRAMGCSGNWARHLVLSAEVMDHPSNYPWKHPHPELNPC